MKKPTKKQIQAAHIESLEAQGFDECKADGKGYVTVRCSQCAAACINGVACHEQSCPNEARARREAARLEREDEDSYLFDEDAEEKEDITDASVRAAFRELDLTLRRDGDEYRVNFAKGKEATAYYTNDLRDALNTGRDMASGINVNKVG